MKKLARQDRNGTRTSEELRRRYKLNEIELTIEEVEYLKQFIEVDSFLSTSSIHPVQNRIVTEALNSKVTKETGKSLSTNDYTDEDKAKAHTHTNKSVLDKVTQTMLDNISNATSNSHTHTNKNVLDTITSELITKWNTASTNTHTHSNKSVLDKITQTLLDNWNRAAAKNTYDLSNYKVSGLTILRSSCIEKNKRVAINFTGTISMAANTTTALFNLPDELKPSQIKDFVVFGQTNNDNGYIGYGQISTEGSLQVRFSTAISSYIRFAVTYDLD